MPEAWDQASAVALHARLVAEFERYRELVAVLPLNRFNLQEDARRYLCLRCAGFLEQMAFLTVHHYVNKVTSGPAASFAHSYFRQAPNLTAKALHDLFERFGDADRARVVRFLDKAHHDALSDLMSVRNQVAHGEEMKGAKLDPSRYLDLCNDFYAWCQVNYLN